MLDGVESVLGHFAAVDPRLVALAVALHLGNLAFRSLAWRNVLAAAYGRERVPLLGVGAAYAAGVALNAFTPARGGDLAKVALARSRIRGSSVPGIASSMAVVSALDAVVAAVLLASAWWLGLLPALPGLPAPVGGGIALAASEPLLVALAAAAGGALAVVAVRRAGPRLRRVRSSLVEGVHVLRSPRRYAREVVPFQLGAWACRVGAAFVLLAAFGLPATASAAVAVVVVGGVATLAPTPGGVGTHQLLLAYVFQKTASTASVVAFSVGMQATVTALNTMLGLAAAMLLFRTMRPAVAVRSGLAASRRRGRG